MTRPGRAAAHLRASRASALLLAPACLAIAACGVSADSPEAQEPVASTSSAIHSSHAGPAPWTHVLTCYGGCAAPHYDSSACNHATSCGPVANGNWWYATERAAFHCGAKLKLVRGSKCVVVDVEDNGPADWVESNADSKCGTPYIIDASPLVADYFGGGCGWGECFLVEVSQVADDTPTGPDGCNTCDCDPGQVQHEGCGNCGTRQRSCGSNCKWGGWSSCEGQGACSPGQQGSQDCCDCGTQHRTCGANCQWQGWSECAGPDPQQGNQACDTGESGPCAQGRTRCRQGCLSCIRLVDPVAESCDAVDNDCDGKTDDGNPKVLGNPPPPWAAQLADVSYPRSLRAGETATIWASFRNVGGTDWKRGQLWLASEGSTQGMPSPLYAAGIWPAWNIAAVLDEDVPAGSSAFFEFEVSGPSDTATASDQFRLMTTDGTLVACPEPSFSVELAVVPATEPKPATPASIESACSCAQGPRQSGSLPALAALAVLFLFLHHRRKQHLAIRLQAASLGRIRVDA